MSKIDQIIQAYGIDKLNSLTKYPSIKTYHILNQRGIVTESLADNQNFSLCDQCYITEKIDGINTRIICADDDYVIGSREELLFAKNDRITHNQLGIASTLKDYATYLSTIYRCPKSIRVIYGEVFGGNTTSHSNQYTDDKTLFDFRIFDILDILDFSILEKTIESIAHWRDNGGQEFRYTPYVELFAACTNIKSVPYLNIVNGKNIPTNRILTYKFLLQFINTRAGINGHSGKSEGIIIRNYDRSLIRKIRFEDYEKTIKIEKWTI